MKLKLKYSASLFLAGANTLCSVGFQFGILSKLEVGARSDLYFASIVMPLVAYTLAFGALNSVLVPMFVETSANKDGEEIALLWNCLLMIVVGAALLSILLYYPVRVAFPLVFRKLSWIDLHQVTDVFLAYSLYQLLNFAVITKNCFLFARGKPVLAQMSVFSGWVVSLAFLWRIQPGQNLGAIPLCLLAGNTVAFLFPNLGKDVFFFRRGLLKQHLISLLKRTLPVTAGCSVGWVEPAIDGVIASSLREGSLTAYFIFSRMILYAVTSISSGYVQPITKNLAELAAANAFWELRRQTRKVVIYGAFLGAGIFGLALVGLPLLSTTGITILRPYALIFSKNLVVFMLLFGYLFGAIAYLGYSNSLYVLRREQLFMAVSLGIFPVGILSKFWGARLLGLAGLASGTSAYWIIYALALWFCFIWVAKQRESVSSHSTYSPILGEQGIEF